jgi:hypothetical protein
MAINPLNFARPEEYQQPRVDWTKLSDIGKNFSEAQDKAELSNLGQQLASGQIDYKQAAGAAAKAGRLDISLSLLKLGEERAAADKFSSFIGGGPSPQQPGTPLSSIAQPQSAPPQPIQPAVNLPNENTVAPPRAEVMPSAKVWGDKEAQAAGLYETPTKVARAPQPVSQSPAMPNVAQNPVSGRISGLIAAVNNPGLPQASRDTAKVLLEHALKSSDIPNDQKDYALYRQQGGTDDFTKWMRANKAAGATMINTAEGMDAAQTKARIAVDTHAVQDISKKVASGRSSLPILTQMMAINDKTPGGWAGAVSPYIAKAAASLGIEVPEGASNSELFQAMSRQFIPSIRDPGSTSNYEQSLYMQAVPSLTQSPEGRAKIANLMKAQINRNGEILATYRKYIGSPELDAKLAELDNKPMFTPDDTKYLKSVQTAQGGQSGPARVNSAAERNALPAGTQYIAPDGTTRTKQ